MKTLVFTYRTSRGKDTYGYNLVSLYVDGKKVAKECGGGYDMSGSCLGTWITDNFQDQLKGLDMSQFYGMREWKGKIICDGGCGFESMKRILTALGYSLERNRHPFKHPSEDYFTLQQLQTA